MNILVVSNNYPSLQAPGRGAFVYNLVQEFAKTNQVTVLVPEKAHNAFKVKAAESYGNEACAVLRPKHLSFSNKKILGFNTVSLTRYFTKKAVSKVLSNLESKPDVVYCHFLTNAIPVLDYVEKNNLLLVIASGESAYSDWQTQPLATQEKLKKLASHFVCVSESNKERLIKLGFDAGKMTVVPNAVNTDLFKPLNKLECKKKLGYSEKDFVVGFVGHFIERKGPNRVIQAITQLNNPAIKLVCVGAGGELEQNNFTQVIPPVPNSSLPETFNAFDVFCLPTLHEGHCNAIEEAKACAIPVISSLGTSVELQLTNQEGVLIEPKNIGAIADALSSLIENKEQHNQLVNNLKSSSPFSIAKRATLIEKILQRVIEC